jgi:protein-S-isoprenylcysteine O-methyltransferase Ste14
VGLYAECSTMGTIVILFVYLLTTIALPVFMWRRRRAMFSPLRHVVVPVIGAATLIVPFVELFKPGQPAPYSWFPYAGLVTIALAAALAHLTIRRNPAAGSAEGLAGAERDSQSERS